MKKTTKAILFSSFIYPGTGHFVLGKRGRGAIYLTAFTLVLAYLVVKIAKVVQMLSQQIETGKLAADINTITLAVNQQMADIVVLNLPIYLLLLLWGMSLLDTVYLAKKSNTPLN